MKGLGKLNHYDGFEVIERFNIDKNQSCANLADWLDAQTDFSDFEQDLLQQIQTELLLHGRAWNEEELKINFIGFVFFLAKLNVPDKIQTFFERKMVGKVEEIPISVVVDGMVASPTKAGRPQVPYFFLQEFKRSISDDHDPEGQMLAAMILAQALNKDNKPLYGCWIQGKNWNFTTLIAKNYCVSKQFDASDTEDLHQIVAILRKLKHLILNR
jgi:flavodoxin